MVVPAARFEAKVDRSGEHHLWTGATDAHGIGQMRIAGRLTTVRRVAWELEHGPLPEGTRVLGCTGEPACVRIEHLDLDAPASPRAHRRGSRGGGSVRAVSRGVWKLTVQVGRHDDGTARRAYRTVRGSKIEATRALADFVNELGDGLSIPSPASRSATVADLVRDYLTHLEEDKGRRHSTLVRYESLLEKWIGPAIGAVRGDALTPGQVDRFLGKMRRAGQSHSSMYQTVVVLNGSYKWARRNRRVRNNPIADVEVPQSTRAPKELIPPDVESLLRLLRAAADSEEEFGLACHLGAVTGMRRGELCGLRWTRVDLDGRSLSVESTVNDAGGRLVVDNFTKTRRTRRVGLDQNTVELLRRHRAMTAKRAEAFGTALVDDAFVLSLAPAGDRPIRPEYLTRRMRQVRRSLGMEGGDFDASLQAMRHWTQTALSEAGYNPRQVARRGGHSEQLMNRVYVHQTKTSDDEMAAYLGALLAPPSRADESA